MFDSRSKHIEIYVHFVRERIDIGQCQMKHMSTTE